MKSNGRTPGVTPITCSAGRFTWAPGSGVIAVSTVPLASEFRKWSL